MGVTLSHDGREKVYFSTARGESGVMDKIGLSQTTGGFTVLIELKVHIVFVITRFIVGETRH
ncbi:hypothetical protein DGG96_16710 [Legionella qingyii]|uniref:Uncharacterized protein n=1 Tax=Legionella qingyii TaxID=2184757 RepID=A0A317U147_9GAMM|nr:hypothetical protein DGG96_16710 [Legionella qingyii]